MMMLEMEENCGGRRPPLRMSPLLSVTVIILALAAAAASVPPGGQGNARIANQFLDPRRALLGVTVARAPSPDAAATRNDTLLYCRSCRSRMVNILYRIRGQVEKTLKFQDIQLQAFPCLAVEATRHLGLIVSDLRIEPAQEAGSVSLQLSTDYGAHWINLIGVGTIGPARPLYIQPHWQLRMVHRMDVHRGFHVLHVSMAVGVWGLTRQAFNTTARCPTFGEARLCQCSEVFHRVNVSVATNDTGEERQPTVAGQQDGHPAEAISAVHGRVRRQSGRYPTPHTPIISPSSRAISANAILLSWKQPIVKGDKKGPKEFVIEISAPGYDEKLTVGCDDCDKGDYVARMSTPTGYGVEFHRLIESLQPFTKYTITVMAVGEEKSSEPTRDIVIRTAEAAPEFPPTGVTVSKVTGHSAKIAWQPIDVAFRHGILQQYEVLVRETQADVIAARGNVSALGNRSSTTVTDLVPLREYAVTVRGFTDAGVSLPSDEVVFTTTETVPGIPTRVKVRPMSPTSVLVMWQPPVHRSQVNETFTVQYWPSAAKAGQSQALQEVTTDTLAFIRGLQPATTYTVQVATVDGTGRGVGSDMINVTTEPIITLGGNAAVNIEASAINSTAVNVTWHAPELMRGQPVEVGSAGVRVSYSLVPTEVSGGKPPGPAVTHRQPQRSQLTPLGQGYGVMTGLTPYSFYNVTVEMVPDANPSNPSNPNANPSLQLLTTSDIIRTPDSVPPPPGDLSVHPEVLHGPSVLVEWTRPAHAQHSVISYTVTAEALPPAAPHRVQHVVNKAQHNITDAAGNVVQWRMTDLRENTEYSVTVQGRNEVGSSYATAMALTTAASVTSEPQDVQALGAAYNAIRVQWRKPAKRVGPILQYTVAYAPVNRSVGGAAAAILPDSVPYVRRLQFSALTSTCLITGLYTGQTYAVWVWASTWTSHGSEQGLPSQAVFAVTDGSATTDHAPHDHSMISEQALLNPQYLEVQSTGPRTVTVRWHRSIAQNIIGYVIRILQIGPAKETAVDSSSTPAVGQQKYLPWLVTRSADMPTEIELRGLRPHSKYAVEVFGFSARMNSTGTGRKFVVTMQSRPSVPPSDLQANPLTSRSLLVTWGTVPSASLNGILHGYQVNLTHEQTSDSSDDHVAYRKQTAFIASNLPNSYTATALHPATPYHVSVAAITDGGVGPPAMALITTHEDAPSDIILDATVINDTSVNVSWSLAPNGRLTQFDLAYHPHTMNVSGSKSGGPLRRNLLHRRNQRYTILNRLSPYHFYTIALSAATSKGSAKKQISVFTAKNAAESQSDMLEILGCRAVSTSSVRVHWSIGRPVAGMFSYLRLLTSEWQNGSAVSIHNVTLPTTARATQMAHLDSSRSYSFRLLAVKRTNGQKVFSLPCNLIAPEYRLDIKKGSSANTTTSTTSFDDSQVVDHKGNTTVVVAVVLPLAVIIVLAAALLAYRCKGCAQWRNTMLYEVACNTPVGKGVLPRWNSPTKLKNVDLASLEHLQIARNRLHNMQPIGEGNFGKVYMAEAEGIGLDRKERTLVAIKALKDTDCPEARRKFYQEMKTMAELSHANLLRLLAVCTKKQPAYLITEFMNEGDLKSVLVASRTYKSQHLSDENLLHIIHQVSSAMNYMSSRHFIHRDLAARNCLVSHGLCVKVADFGLTRRVGHASMDYYRASDGLLPVRWMPPEALFDGIFSTASDIWAFGVFCWEVYTLGQLPYPGCANTQIVSWIRDGNRLPRPDLCPEHIYESMQACWREEAGVRPNFKLLHEFVSACMDASSKRQQSVHTFDAYDSDGDYVISNSGAADSGEFEEVDLDGYENAWDTCEYDVADAPHLVMKSKAARKRL